MSRQLSLSAALSVALMSLYAACGGHSVQVPVGSQTTFMSPVRAAASVLPSEGNWLTPLR